MPCAASRLPAGGASLTHGGHQPHLQTHPADPCPDQTWPHIQCMSWSSSCISQDVTCVYCWSNTYHSQHTPPPLPRQTHARPLRRSAQSRVAVAYMLPAGMDTLSACMQPTSALFCTPWTTARVTGMGPCCSCCCCHGYMALPVAGRLLSLQRRCSVELQELP